MHIYKFDLVKFGIPDSHICVKCSKGTYVRTLCHDIGKQLGCGGHLASLRRTASGRLSLENAITFDALKNLPRAELSQHVIPILSADI